MGVANTIVDQALGAANGYGADASSAALAAYNIAGEHIFVDLTAPTITDVVDVTQPTEIGVPTITAPSITIPAPATSITGPDLEGDWATTSIYNNFSSVYNQLYTTAVNAIDGFLDTYFPTDSLPDWIAQTIAAKGDTQAEVSDKYWAKARNQIAAETTISINQLDARTSGRGAPLPTGARNAVLSELLIQQSDKLAEVSQQAAIKQIDTAVDVLKTAVSASVQSRQTALDAATKYISALLTPADIASKFVIPLSSYKSQYISALADYYRAQLSRDELILKAETAQADLELRSSTASGELAIKAGSTNIELGLRAESTRSELDLKSELQRVDNTIEMRKLTVELNLKQLEERIKAALGAANAAAEIAKGAMSSIHGMGSVSATE